jgi:hypothetical protein
LAQPGGARPHFEALLPAQRRFVFEKQAEPLGMFEAAGLCVGGQVLEAFGHAVQAEGVQSIEGRVDQHDRFLFQLK